MRLTPEREAQFKSYGLTARESILFAEIDDLRAELVKKATHVDCLEREVQELYRRDAYIVAPQSTVKILRKQNAALLAACEAALYDCSPGIAAKLKAAIKAAKEGL